MEVKQRVVAEKLTVSELVTTQLLALPPVVQVPSCKHSTQTVIGNGISLWRYLAQSQVDSQAHAERRIIYLVIPRKHSMLTKASRCSTLEDCPLDLEHGYWHAQDPCIMSCSKLPEAVDARGSAAECAGLAAHWCNMVRLQVDAQHLDPPIKG